MPTPWLATFRPAPEHGAAISDLLDSPDWLSPAWRHQRQWQILAIQTDLGLDFLGAWAAWHSDASRPALLHVVCLVPSAPSDHSVRQAAAQHPSLQGFARELSLQCQGLLPGVHRLSFEGGAVLLTLCIGPVLALLKEQALRADVVLMDQAALPLLKAAARCCRRGTRLHASAAEPDLPALGAACGFMPATDLSPADLAANKPAAPKRWAAVFDPPWQLRQKHRPHTRTQADPGHCTVIGAGLAGAACAASLARRGWQVTVLDRHGPAAGASGLPVGLMAPHVSIDDSPLSRLSRAGIRATLHEAQRLLRQGQDWAPTGVLQRRLDDAGALPPDWPQEGRYWSCHHSEHALTNRTLGDKDLWHGCGAWIKPAKLIQAWLGQPGITVRAAAEVTELRFGSEHTHNADHEWQMLGPSGELLSSSALVVLANAHEAAALLQPFMDDSPAKLQAIRGQVSWARHAPGEQLPAWPVNGHGSLVPSFPDGPEQAWLLGASFERDDTRSDLRPQDHAANLEKLRQLLPETAVSLQLRFAQGQVQGWAGVRCAFRDHLPVVGPFSASHPGLWLCTAFGSRGLSYSALCAELLAAWLHDEPLPLEPRLAQALQASRLLQGR